ncbi:hypothetical protein ACIHEI_35305 [Kitasatospora sp. NPDC051984]
MADRDRRRGAQDVHGEVERHALMDAMLRGWIADAQATGVRPRLRPCC